jgi:hypothetical protein
MSCDDNGDLDWRQRSLLEENSNLAPKVMNTHGALSNLSYSMSPYGDIDLARSDA